jgi:maltose O-acetyltransferase
MLAGELYIADDLQLAVDSLRALKLTQQFNTSDPSNPQARRAVLRELLGSLGEGTEIRPPLYCDYGYQSHVGGADLHQLRRRPVGCGLDHDR